MTSQLLACVFPRGYLLQDRFQGGKKVDRELVPWCVVAEICQELIPKTRLFSLVPAEPEKIRSQPVTHRNLPLPLSLRVECPDSCELGFKIDIGPL